MTTEGHHLRSTFGRSFLHTNCVKYLQLENIVSTPTPYLVLFVCPFVISRVVTANDKSSTSSTPPNINLFLISF